MSCGEISRMLLMSTARQVAHAWNPSTWEVKPGQSIAPGQSSLCSEFEASLGYINNTLSQDNNKRDWREKEIELQSLGLFVRITLTSSKHTLEALFCIQRFHSIINDMSFYIQRFHSIINDTSFYKRQTPFPLKKQPYNSLSSQSNQDVRKGHLQVLPPAWRGRDSHPVEKTDNERAKSSTRKRRPALGSHAYRQCFSPGPGWESHCPRSSCCSSSAALP